MAPLTSRLRYLAVAVLALALLVGAGSAQAAGPPAEVSHAVHADKSPPLRKLHPLPPHHGGGPPEIRRRENPPFGGTPLGADPASATNVDAWVHWTLSRAGSSLTLYRNGVQIASRSDLPSATAASLQGVIGRQVTSYPAKAAIDDVAVYGAALSGPTVQTHFLAG